MKSFKGKRLCGYIAIKKGSVADTNCFKKYHFVCSPKPEDETTTSTSTTTTTTTSTTTSTTTTTTTTTSTTTTTTTTTTTSTTTTTTTTTTEEEIEDYDVITTVTSPEETTTAFEEGFDERRKGNRITAQDIYASGLTKEQLKEQKLREREQKKKDREAEKLAKELEKLKEAREAEDLASGPDGFKGKSFGGLPVLDFRSRKIGKAGTMNKLPDLSDPRKPAGSAREVFVQYDSDKDGNTDWEDTVHPSIEYIEANGVMMFHLDYEQNRQYICNDDWPYSTPANPMSAEDQTALCGLPNCADEFDLNKRPMLYDNRCQSTSTAQNPDPSPPPTGTAWNDWLPMCGGDADTEPNRQCDATDTCCHVYRGLNWTQSGEFQNFEIFGRKKI